MPDSESCTLYQTRINISGDTSRDRQITKAKRALERSFIKSPSYYSVSLNGSTIDSNIMDDSKEKEQKIFITQIDDVQNAGDIILWNGQYWITLIVDNMHDIYYRGNIKKCESSLKWKNSTGAIKEAYFTLAASDQRGLGIEDGKVMILPSERRYITLQNNADTLQIVKNQRFIFDNSKIWSVVSVNSLKTGLISIEMEENEFSDELDYLSLRIANYYDHTYSIEIANGSSANITTAGTLQLSAVTKDNGVVSSLPITYTSLTPSIATVNSSGLISGVSNGTVSIKAALTSDPTVFDTISVVVAASASTNYELVISGNDFCKLTTQQVYSGVISNNGAIDGSKTILWTVRGDDLTSLTNLATILSQNSTSVTIKANNSILGYIRVIGTCIEDGSIVGNKRIQIKSLI